MKPFETPRPLSRSGRCLQRRPWPPTRPRHPHHVEQLSPGAGSKHDVWGPQPHSRNHCLEPPLNTPDRLWTGQSTAVCQALAAAAAAAAEALDSQPARVQHGGASGGRHPGRTAR